MPRNFFAFLFGILPLASACVTAAPQGNTPKDLPIIIAHRGASGHLPEHTLEAYTLAINQDADFIEPDLVSTKDGILVVRHENEIGKTTDAAQKFPDRKKTKTIDGEKVEGFFVEDFTLAEIKSLRAREWMPFRSKANDGKFQVPTFDEVLILVKEKSKEKKKDIGVYPELKHPSYFRSIQLPLEDRAVASLHGKGFLEESAPVFLQCFEVEPLKNLAQKTKLRRVFLIGESGQPYDLTLKGDKRTYADFLTKDGLKEVRTFAHGIGPSKKLIVPRTKGDSSAPPTTLVADAHAASLLVHPYTFRNERYFLAGDHGGDPMKEYFQFFELGVDGLFSDYPDTAIKARHLFFVEGRR